MGVGLVNDRRILVMLRDFREDFRGETDLNYRSRTRKTPEALLFRKYLSGFEPANTGPSFSF